MTYYGYGEPIFISSLAKEQIIALVRRLPSLNFLDSCFLSFSITSLRLLSYQQKYLSCVFVLVRLKPCLILFFDIAQGLEFLGSSGRDTLQRFRLIELKFRFPF